MFERESCQRAKAESSGNNDSATVNRANQQENTDWRRLALKQAAFLSRPSIQLKTAISRPGDSQEQEADQIAEHVVSLPSPSPIGRKLQSATAGPGHLQRKADEDEEEELQRKENGEDSGLPKFAPPIVGQALTSPGQPLDQVTRDYFEPRFGHDFSHVRIHTDTLAAESARSVKAQAYTLGHDVVFDIGRFATGTVEGRKLLAHELTHVVQQGARPIPNGAIPMNESAAGAEREASIASKNVMAGRAGSISSFNPGVARAPVSDYGAVEQLEIERTDMETAKQHVPGFDRLDDAYDLIHTDPVLDRFGKNPEERDAVYDVAWQIRPAKLTSATEMTVGIPARGSAQALMYKFIFTPRDPKDKAAKKDKLDIVFKAEGAAATIVSPPSVAGATRPKTLSGSGFEGGSDEYFKIHPDEGKQLYGWLAAQKGDEYDQLMVTSETTGAGPAAKKHESTLRVTKAKGDPEINVELIGEFRLDQKTPSADYRRDHADDLIAKAQAKGDPGQKTKPDKLGAVTGVSAFPADELFSVKYFAFSLFETTTKSAGLRNAESKGVVNIAGSTKQVLISVTIAPSAAKKTFDMDIQRIGEVGKDAQIDPKKAKPDVGRAAGFPTAGDAAAVLSFVAKRYPALSGVSGGKPEEVRGAANKLLETEASTLGYFSKNYNVSVLDATAAATRLQTVNKLDPAQATDMKDFTSSELWSLELALETLSDALITNLKGTAFTRQKMEIIDHGPKAATRFTTSNEHGGVTWGRGSAPDRTVVLFDGFHDNETTSFMGSKKESVLPILDFTILHEIGHAIDDTTSARAAFNKKFPKLRGFTDYARHNMKLEAFEEAFAIFQGDPEWLKTNHKDVFDWFTAFSSSGTVPR